MSPEFLQNLPTSISHFIYDFQTLLIGAAAIVAAIITGIPVWRQLKDSNLQTRISHRETLATLMRDALRRYAKVDNSIRETLSQASRATSDPVGEPIELQSEDANYLEQRLHGTLDWYLVDLADTEHAEIESRKVRLKVALDRLVGTLCDAHWADHNDQQDEERNTPDDEWAEVLAGCARAKIEATERVNEVQSAYRELGSAQHQWVQSLRTQIARLDLQISAPK